MPGIVLGKRYETATCPVNYKLFITAKNMDAWGGGNFTKFHVTIMPSNSHALFCHLKFFIKTL